MSSSKQQKSPDQEYAGIRKSQSSRMLKNERERQDPRRQQALEAHLKMQEEDETDSSADETDSSADETDSPAASVVEVDPDERAESRLRVHIGIGTDQPLEKTVFFFIEKTPPSIRGTGCQLPSCGDKIKEGRYRVAVQPGMNNYYGRPDFYHLKCFEKLADFSQMDYLARVEPVHRNMLGLRQIKSTGVLDGYYLLDGGAERLVLEWKVSMGGLIYQREGIAVQQLEPDFNDLLRKSGSASFSPKQIPNMTLHEFYLLSRRLAPIESDGEGDTEEWNLFTAYLSHDFEDVKDLDDRNSLSKMLVRWKSDRFLANADPEELTEAGKEARKRLSEKAIRGIKRLLIIPMPNFQAY